MLRCTEEDGASAGPGSTIKDADQVIVYMRQDEMKAVIVDASACFNCRFGSFKMQVSFIGMAISMRQDACNIQKYAIQSRIGSDDLLASI